MSLERRNFISYKDKVARFLNNKGLVGKTIGEVLENCRDFHREQYKNDSLANTNRFINAAREISQFILAGLAWMSQKIIIQTKVEADRHSRKRYIKKYKISPPAITIVHLRKSESFHSSHNDSDREYSVRWLVGGHWRNQPYGVKHGDRKLIYISPYIKGPGDKPFKVPVTKVFEVSR